MTDKQIELVKRSWAIVAGLDQVTVGTLFYERLFQIAPQLKHMFRSPVAGQSRKLLAMINYIIIKLDKLDDILDEVTRLAHRHVSYGVKPDHYRTVGDALLWTLEKGLGENWNSELRDAWNDCYQLLSSAMINAVEWEEQPAA